MSNDVLIVVVKLLHTAIFVFVSGCILYVVRSGLTGRTTTWLLLACIAIPSAVGFAWLVNGRERLIATVVYGLAGGDHDVSDIFLPRSISGRVMTGSTIVLAFGCLLVTLRTVAHRWSDSESVKSAREPMKNTAIDPAVAAQRIDDRSFPASAEAEKGRDVAKPAVSPLAICRAAALYFALTFAAGFALGAIRIFAIAHGLGEWQAVLIETPFMLLISWKACSLAIGIFDISGRAAAFGVGAIAFLLLQSAELTLALLAFDKSPGDFVAGYRTAAGMIGLSGQVAFGFFPWVKVELR